MHPTKRGESKWKKVTNEWMEKSFESEYKWKWWVMPRFVATIFRMKIEKKNQTKSAWLCTKRAILHFVYKTCPVRRRYSSEVSCVLFSQFHILFLLDVSSALSEMVTFVLLNWTSVMCNGWMNSWCYVVSRYLHIHTFSNIVEMGPQSWPIFFCRTSSLWILLKSKKFLLLFICWRSHLFVCVWLLSIVYEDNNWIKGPISWTHLHWKMSC